MVNPSPEAWAFFGLVVGGIVTIVVTLIKTSPKEAVVKQTEERRQADVHHSESMTALTSTIQQVNETLGNQTSALSQLTGAVNHHGTRINKVENTLTEHGQEIERLKGKK